MNVSFFCVLFAFLMNSQLALCKNILAIFPHPGKSHFYMYEPYVQKLAERGHNVTVISWFKTQDHRNIELILIGGEVPTMRLNLVEYESMPRFLMGLTELQMLNSMGQEACTLGLSDPKVKDLIKSKKHFDLVVVEYFNSDCFAVFSHIFKAPLVGIFSSAAMPWQNDRMGNPDNPSYIPNMFTGFQSEMHFFSRVQNTLSLYFMKIYYKIFYNGPTDKIIKKELGKGIPKVEEIVKNTSVFLVNSHYSVFQPRPCVPGFVEVAGLHIQEPKKLPADLEKYLSNSKNGVVYFSLGTVTNGSSLPPKKRDAILKAFGSISMDVLWKWEGDEMPGKPKNVITRKWVPQNDLLAHPKVKLFITHGGLMGTLEAVSHGVPMMMIPLFGDQFLNAASISEKGAGVVVDYLTLNEFKFQRTLKEVLENKSYAEKAKLLAATFKERPLTAMNSAIYWTEYVLKFKGAPHLKSAAVKLSWISEQLIDVWAFLIIILLLIIHFGRKAVVKIIAMRKASEDAKKKKK